MDKWFECLAYLTLTNMSLWSLLLLSHTSISTSDEKKRLCGFQVRLQRLQDKIKSFHSDVPEPHKHTKDNSNPAPSLTQSLQFPSNLPSTTQEDDTKNKMGKEAELSDQNTLSHTSLHRNLARSDAGSLLDDSGSQSSNLSVKTADGVLSAFQSDIPNMKLWRRFMNEKQNSQQRRVPLMINTWATRRHSE